jgi:hypothetical protein
MADYFLGLAATFSQANNAIRSYGHYKIASLADPRSEIRGLRSFAFLGISRKTAQVQFRL